MIHELIDYLNKEDKGRYISSIHNRSYTYALSRVGIVRDTGKWISLTDLNNEGKGYFFHSGCNRCKMQLESSWLLCKGCQYFEANWDLPNLNTSEAKESKLDKLLKQIKDLLDEQPS